MALAPPVKSRVAKAPAFVPTPLMVLPVAPALFAVKVTVVPVLAPAETCVFCVVPAP